MPVPVGEQARVGERGDIEGSYPSFCYSTTDPFAALVAELAATSTGREGSREWGEAPEEQEELHLVVGKMWKERKHMGRQIDAVMLWHKQDVKHKDLILMHNE